MRNYGKPVTDEVVREFLPLDIALYSVWMPGDPTTAAIQSTRLDPVCTYDGSIGGPASPGSPASGSAGRRAAGKRPELNGQRFLKMTLCRQSDPASASS